MKTVDLSRMQTGLLCACAMLENKEVDFDHESGVDVAPRRSSLLSITTFYSVRYTSSKGKRGTRRKEFYIVVSRIRACHATLASFKKLTLMLKLIR